MPRSIARSAPSRSARRPSTDRSKAPSTSANRSRANQYRLFLIASGFGMNVKLVGSFKPNPETGQLTADFENLPQPPFETFQLHLFSGERALMATPIACTIYTVSADFFPWDAALRRTESRPRSSASNQAPTEPNARARSAPSTRPWKPAPPTRPPAPSPPSP